MKIGLEEKNKNNGVEMNERETVYSPENLFLLIDFGNVFSQRDLWKEGKRGTFLRYDP